MPGGLRACCPLRLECSSPDPHSAPSLTTFRSLLKCHLFNKAQAHQPISNTTPCPSSPSSCHLPLFIIRLYIYIYTHTHTHTYIYTHTHTHIHIFFWLCCATWDPSSPTRDRTHSPCIGNSSLNHWTAREVPVHRPQHCWLDHVFSMFTAWLLSLALTRAGTPGLAHAQPHP